MQDRKQAAQFMSNIAQDYAESMKRDGHKQAAEIMLATCQASLSTLLRADTSNTPVPDGGNTD